MSSGKHPDTTVTSTPSTDAPKAASRSAQATTCPRLPVNNWRTVICQGLVIWVVVTAVFLGLSPGHPLQLGVAIVWIYVFPLVPTGLYLDVRQAHRTSTCRLTARIYMKNLAHDFANCVRRDGSLGDARRDMAACGSEGRDTSDIPCPEPALVGDSAHSDTDLTAVQRRQLSADQVGGGIGPSNRWVASVERSLSKMNRNSNKAQDRRFNCRKGTNSRPTEHILHS
jgi:hypothetical protein